MLFSLTKATKIKLTFIGHVPQ